MKKILLLIFVSFCASIIWAQNIPDTIQKVIPGRTNSPEQQQKPYLILISADGFRYDYAEKYQAQNLLALSKEGVRAESMIPSYPSLTFPNHYTLVTGLYPSHHGLVNNYFYDRNRKAFYSMKNEKTVTDGSWYGGTPLWVLAEQQQMLTASFYWVGSEAAINGILPTYYYSYNEAIPIDRRIQIVKEWLELPAERRPHLITFYFPEVDHEGHIYGPDAPETAQAVRWLDSSVQKLVDNVRATGLPVNFIFVSDHGMTKIDTEHSLGMPSAIDTNKFFIPSGAELVELYAKNKENVSDTYVKLLQEAKGYKVYLKENMAARLHYGSEDDTMDRIGDILLIPDWPNEFNFSSRKPRPGAHGYDPYLVKDMHATFFAWGPAFKNDFTIPSFQNVNVYPVVTTILGLKYTDKIDGTPAVAHEILK
ncbi:MAG: alkaline phosphatase family protein [Bacteroidetes bacterium]|nr:alkaline phosphatase family protein [Bacteroidota bacterium]MBS1930011.1 alkaline phosphatase family protein [Bacteroidota bacterium]